MSLRKITTLLLLVAFAFTQVPVQAASLTRDGATAPSVIVDSGTPAEGANRDVVPVNIVVDATGNETSYSTYNSPNIETFTVLDNGALSTANGGNLVGDLRAIILTPPDNTEFVGLNGYTATVTATINGKVATADENAFVNVDTLATVQMPARVGGVSDSVILAKVLTENGGASFFGGQDIRAGSVIVYTITNQTSSTFGPAVDADIKLKNIGLAVAAGTTLPSTLDVTYVEATSSSIDEAVNLANNTTLTIATPTTDANGQVAVALETETNAQSNSVLADLLTTAGTVVKVGPGYITSTVKNQSILYVDTDALLIQAGETPTSTSSVPVYYDTPFNTSAYTGILSNGANTSVLNAALTSASFPNQDNALITVTYSLAPLNGSGSTDATLVVDAASVSLVDGSTNRLGFLGSTINLPTENGTALGANDPAVAVLYNGASATGTLRVLDFEPLATITDLTTVDQNFGFDVAVVPMATKRGPDAATNFLVNNGSTATGVFPGVSLSSFGANDAQTVTVSNGKTNFVTVGTDVADNGDHLFVRDEVTARLLPTGGNALFVLTGTQDADNIADATKDLRIAPTNFGTVPYNTEAVLGSDEDDLIVKNNVIAAARLTSSTVQILPMVNKYDGVRDTIKVRPELTVTLGATSKAQGLRVLATVTGNNIAGSKVIEVARVNASGSTDVDATVQALPAAGTSTRLLAENGTDASTLRAALDIGSITNATSNDEIADLISNGSVLDDTLPSFFCGGTAGTVTNGPNGVPVQPYRRAILVQESTSGAFDTAFVGGGNDVIRFTLPVGMDLVKKSATAASNDVAVDSTDGGAVGTFSSSPAIVDYQTVSEQLGGQAFIDVSYSAAVAGTTTVKKAVALFFGAHSLVIPEGQTDFDVTVSIVNDDGTSTVGSDVVLDVLGTTPIATGCATPFTISYCDDALANYGKTGNGPVESDVIANGSLLTSFSSDVSSGVRLLNTDTTAFRIPDICITESVADAFPGGAATTTPSIFGGGTRTVSLAISDPGDATVNSANIGFQSVATEVYQSDDSLAFSNANITGGPPGQLLNSNVTIGTDTDEFTQFTEIRFTDITMAKTSSAGSNFQPPIQNFAVFLNDGTNHIATSIPATFETRGNNGTAFSPLGAGGVEDEFINTFFNGNLIGDSTNVEDSDSADFTNGQFLNLVFTNAAAGSVLLNAVKTVNDSTSAYQQLNDDTKLSIAVDDIEAVTNGLAAFTKITVFTSTGELEPGSMIQIVASSGDSVVVPVTDDGNFMAELRGAEGDTLVITQTPTSTLTSADQQVIVTATNQNLAPTLLSAVAQNFTEIGTVTAQGTAPVLFTVSAVGRLDGETFKPTADQLSISGNPVYAVPGTDDTFLGMVDFRKTDGTVVTANVTGNPSVNITNIDSDFPTFPKRTRPRLFKAKTKTRKKDGETRVLFKGKRLRNAGIGYVVKADGTVQNVTFRRRTRNDRARNRVVSESSASLPTDAVFAVYHVRGRGITTLDISN